MGVDWEGALITQEFYDACSRTLKFDPILFDPGDVACILELMRGLTHDTLNSEAGYSALSDFLTGVAGIEPSPVGTRPPTQPTQIGDAAGSERDLCEEWESASRGAMRLFQADIQLTRARMFQDRPSLAAARQLIETCG